MRLKPLSFLVLGLAVIGGATLAWTSVQPTADPAHPTAITPPAARASIDDICATPPKASRQMYVDITYETSDPSRALAQLQAEMSRREGGVTYASSTSGDYASASINGWLPAGADTAWLSGLDVGKVVSINNSDNMAGPEVGDACKRLETLQRAEQMVVDALVAGGDREAAMTLLQLNRYEIDNQRAIIHSMQYDGGRTQVNVYFNTPYVDVEPLYYE